MTIVERFKQGNHEAFESIYEQYHHKVYRFAWSYVKDADAAQEMTQQIFIRIWEKRALLSTDKPFEGQIFLIARNLIIDNLRKQARNKELEMHYALFHPKADDQTENDITQADYQKHVDTLIEGMPPRRRLIFKMNKEEGLNFEEIAQALSISPKTVDAHIQLAVKYLRKKLANLLHIFF